MIDYEKLRLENIHRNENFLKLLGFETNRANSHEFDGLPRFNNRKRKSSDDTGHLKTDLRRSPRLLNVKQVTDVPPTSVLDDPNPSKPNSKNQIQQQFLNKRNFINVHDTREINPLSCRYIVADLSPFYNKLAEPLDEYGKAVVMTISNGGKLPSFSKYSGLAEWKNAIFLWVNIGNDSESGYLNEFLEAGKRITWFGGSKMHADTPAIMRMRRSFSDHRATGYETEADSQSTVEGDKKSSKGRSSVRIVLFVRLPKQGYACLGEVQEFSSDLTSHPVAFVFELLDYEQIKNKEYFQKILALH